MSIPQDLHYTKDHEWARVESDGMVSIGITEYAQEQLGDIVYVEFPSAGEEVSQDESFGVVESTKSVSELIAPLSGTVQESNTVLNEEPQLVNEDPFGEGWIIRISPENLDELEALMSAEEYEEYIGELG